MPDLHDLPPDVFHRQVRSFSYWLESVRDYLPSEDGFVLPEAEVPLEDREGLITVLCTYCVGETIALEGAGGLIRIAPNRDSKIFLSTQTIDEGRHLELFVTRLEELGVEDVEKEIESRVNPYLLEFRGRLLALVADGEWESALFAQNVVLEAMEFAAFDSHMATADPRTRAMLEGVVKDERRHMGFGENELGSALAARPALKVPLAHLRRELDYLVLGSFEHTLTELGIPLSERPSLTRTYLGVIERLGFT